MLKIVLEPVESFKPEDPSLNQGFGVEYLLPIPKMIKLGKKWTKISEKFTMNAFGDFLSQDMINKRVDLPSIPEPDWDVKEFSKKIPTVLGQYLMHVPEISIQFNKHDNMLGEKPEAFIKFIPADSRSEAYYLKVEQNKIQLYSWSLRGSYYAFQTLSQLFTEKDKELFLPEIEIMDYPDFEIRGLVDDISRGQRPTMDNFKKFIDFMSAIKLNTLTLYIEDMFKFDKYPSIGRNRAPLTREVIKELETYAMDHFIEIQPGFECFGHQENMLMQPKFQKHAEFPGAQCFDISSQEAKEFVDDLLSEICPAFNSKAFHLICDESHDFNYGKSRELVNDIGEAEALAQWYLFLVETTKKYGKDYPTIAHDIIYKYPKTLEMVQGKIPLISYWNYSDKKKYPIISKLKEKGFTMAGLPGMFDWSRHYPYYDYAAKNMIYMAQDGLERGLIGHITTKWGDFFNENFRENIYYGLAIEGQASWNAHASDIQKIEKGFERFFFGTIDSGVIQIMDILNKQNDKLPTYPNGMFNRYWMDPYCRKINPKKEYPYANRIVEESIFLLKKIKYMNENHVLARNQDNLDYLQFAARMALHYGVKLLASESAFNENFALVSNIIVFLEQLKDFKMSHGVDFPPKIKDLRDLKPIFEWLAKDVINQEENYRDLWLRIAEPEGLEYPSRRFDVLHWHYEQSISALSKNIKPKAHQLKSEWIWRSGRRHSPSWGNQEWYYFFKSFSVNSRVKRARIQAIASTHMKINLNGSHVGEVISRFALSQLPMAEAVQVFDVTDSIQSKDTNILCIEGINWARGLGGINVLVHLEYDNGEVEDIFSNESWKYSKKQPLNWPWQKEPSKSQLSTFKTVRSFGAPPEGWNGPITAPIWENDWKSEISFSFGLRNFVETSIKNFIGERTYKLLFWLIPRVMPLFADVTGFREHGT